MPTRQQHLDKSASNEALSVTLENGSHSDWAVITMFYAALHLIDAYLAGYALHPRTHVERNGYVQRMSDLRQVWIRYQFLDHRSRDARYRCLPFSSREAANLRQGAFEPLKQHLRTALGI